MKQLGLFPTLHGEWLGVTESKGTNADSMEHWPYSIAALKVRELPEADPNASAMSISEAEIGQIESELGRLADGLEPEQAAKGLELHEQFIGTSRRLF